MNVGTNTSVLVRPRFAACVLMQVDCVGIYRWSCKFTGRASIGERRADLPQGSDDLPLYTAIAVALLARLQSPISDGLVIDMPLARIGQPLGEVGLPPANAATSQCFAFFSMEAAGKFAIAP